MPNVKLKIIGVGSEYTRLKKLTTNLNLDPNIKFLGKIDRSEIVDEFKNSNITI